MGRGLLECAPIARTASPRAASSTTALTAPILATDGGWSLLQAGGGEKAAVVEPQSALPALLARWISSVMPRRQHWRRGEWNRGRERDVGPRRSIHPIAGLTPRCGYP